VNKQAIALVTGGGKRVGAAIARRLGREGYHVVIHYNRSETGARETLQAIRDSGGDGEIRQANLATRGEAERLIQ